MAAQTGTSKVFVFDFDGTLCHSLDAVREAVNLFSDEFGFEKIAEKDVETWRNKGSREVFKALGVSMMRLPFLVRKVRKAIQKDTDRMPLVEGIGEVLRKLKDRGYQLGILTSNSSENVEKFLEKHGLDLFDFIHSGSSIFGKGKMLKQMLKDLNADRGDVVYVGDETRDIEAARSAQIRAVSVCWGFSSRTALERESPDFLVEDPQGLLQVT